MGSRTLSKKRQLESKQSMIRQTKGTILKQKMESLMNGPLLPKINTKLPHINTTIIRNRDEQWWKPNSVDRTLLKIKLLKSNNASWINWKEPMRGKKLINNLNSFARRDKNRRRIKRTGRKLTGRKLRFKCLITKHPSLLRVYGIRRLNTLWQWMLWHVSSKWKKYKKMLDSIVERCWTRDIIDKLQRWSSQTMNRKFQISQVLYL